MSRHVWEFVVAVFKRWGTLVTGGFVVGLIAIYEHLSRRPMTGRLFWIAVVISLLATFFSVWRKERLTVESNTTNLLSLSQSELLEIFNQRTTIHGEGMASMYVGKWIEVAGPISDVRIYKNPLTHLFHKTGAIATLRPTPFVFLVFRRKWIGPLSALRSGETVKVFGRIKTIAANELWLRDCELRPFGPQVNA